MKLSQAQIDDTIFVNQSYELVGIAIFFSNLLVLITFFSAAQLRNKFQILIFLAFADQVAGVGRFLAGYYRVTMYQNLPDIPLPTNTTVAYCLKSPWLPFLLLGCQWSATICLLMGLERLFLVFNPLTYRALVTDRMRIIFVLVSLAIIFFVMVASYTFLFVLKIDAPANFNCNVNQVFPTYYVDFHRLYTCAAHTVGFVLTVVAFSRARKKSKRAGRDGADMAAEAKKINSLLVVTGVSVLLVVVPTFSTWARDRDLINLPSFLTQYSSITFNINATTNLLIYFVFNRAFRSRFIYLITCSKISLNASGAPVHLIQVR